MLKIRFLLVLLFVFFSFLGCQEKSTSGPAEIHWDRDMCDRCVMVLSDRKNTVQLQHPNEKKTYKFDDIGCMVLWLKEEGAAFSNGAKIWITDAKTGEWIDARSAFYTSENVTPMAFGYSAYGSKESIKEDEEILTYDEVVQKIK